MPAPGLGSLNRPRGFSEWVKKQLAEQAKQISQNATARTLNNATVGDSSGGGGTLTLAPGGLLSVLDSSGNVIGAIGTNNATGVIGFATFRPDGSAMLSSLPVGFAGLTYTAVQDANAFIVLADDPVQAGLLRPYLTLGPMVDWSTPGTPGGVTTSATFVDVQVAYCVRQHGRVRWDVIVSSSDPATTGNVQLVDAVGNVVGSPIAVPAGAVSIVSLGPVAWPVGTWTAGDQMYMKAQAQVTAGTGSIGVRTTGLWGMGSS